MYVIEIILYIGAAQGLALSLVLFTLKRGNVLANRLLAMKLLLFSNIIFVHTFEHSGYKIPFSHHSVLEHSLFFMFGPLLYLYTRSLTSYHFRFKKKHLLHFIPMMVCVSGITASVISNSPIPHSIEVAGSVFLSLFTIVYFLVTILTLRKHTKTIKENFSSLEKINLNWLRFLLSGYGLIWFTAIFIEGMSMHDKGWHWLWMALSVLMYSIGYMGLRQPEIFTGPVEQSSEQNKPSGKKYSKSSLTPELEEKYLEKLNKHIKSQKTYLDNNITLAVLSGQLSIPSHHLSQTINNRLGKNFFEFISHHRVEEAKKILTNRKKAHLNIAAIGFESGFNSISAFNSAFKKITGLTPTQYKDHNTK